MADQNYGDSQQAVQVFYPATATQGTNLQQEVAVSGSPGDRLASLLAGSNRYTATSVSFIYLGNVSGAVVSVNKALNPSGAGFSSLGSISLPSGTTGDVARCALAIDLLPGETCILTLESSGTGSVSITFDGYTSSFGPTEGEVEKPSGSKVINVTGEAGEITPVVLIADLPEESGDE